MFMEETKQMLSFTLSMGDKISNRFSIAMALLRVQLSEESTWMSLELLSMTVQR
jgi:hypothetical protein